MLNRRSCLLAAAAWPAGVTSWTGKTALRYLEAPGHDAFNSFAIGLLGAAIQRAALPCALEGVRYIPMTQGRMELELRQERASLDIMWAMTSQSREQSLCPIRIPLDRGLLGWRVALIRKSDLPRWKTAPNREELARRHAGQGLHWPDIEIMRANDLRVEAAADNRALCEMLIAGRIDYFPRSVLEARDDLNRLGQDQLTIAPGFALHYPAASYAFLSPHHEHWVAPLAKALDALVTNGTLRQRFRRSFQDEIDALCLADRKIITLRNPLLPGGTPLNRTEYWWNPAEA
ncbi:MAG: hypothetical protein JO006_12790 [Paucibacter sp.]|nr:hypothetical protein [Roseateles sp.]